jgi:hypothetical protein
LGRGCDDAVDNADDLADVDANNNDGGGDRHNQRNGEGRHRRGVTWCAGSSLRARGALRDHEQFREL